MVPIEATIQQGNIKELKKQLEGFDINSTYNGKTLLYFAAKHRQHKVAKVLLNQYKASPNVDILLFFGNSPLYPAVNNLDHKMVRLLLRYKAIPYIEKNSPDFIPLYPQAPVAKTAIEKELYEIFKDLVRYAQDPNQRYDTETLLHHAINLVLNTNSDFKVSYSIVHLLLSYPTIDTRPYKVNDTVQDGPLTYLIGKFIQKVNENPLYFPIELFKRTARCLDLFLLADENLKPLVNAMIDGNYQARDKELSSICSALYFPENIQAKTSLINSMEETVHKLKAIQKNHQMPLQPALHYLLLCIQPHEQKGLLQLKKKKKDETTENLPIPSKDESTKCFLMDLKKTLLSILKSNKGKEYSRIQDLPLDLKWTIFEYMLVAYNSPEKPEFANTPSFKEESGLCTPARLTS